MTAGHSTAAAAAECWLSPLEFRCWRRIPSLRPGLASLYAVDRQLSTSPSAIVMVPVWTVR